MQRDMTAGLTGLVSRCLWALAVLAAAAVPVVQGGCKISASTCYDDMNHQVFGPYIFHGAITLEYCAQVCADKGNGTFALAGAGGTNGNECFCGNTVDPAIRKSKQCDAACSANHAQTCGGSYLMDVFAFSCSGKPVPEPPQPPPPPPHRSRARHRSTARQAQPARPICTTPASCRGRRRVPCRSAM